MVTYSASIIEDDATTRFLIEELLSQSGRFELASSLSNPIEALRDPLLVNSDVLFLDVEMPELSGIELAKILDPGVRIIITTSEEKYALDAFGVNAFDFILKPVSLPRLLEVAKKLDNSIPTGHNKPVFLKTKDGHLRINLNDVLAVSAERDYVFYHTKETRHIVRQSMAQVLKISSEYPLIQVHRSHIVNLDHVSSFNSDSINVGDMQVPLSRGFKEAFLSRINKIV